MTKWGIIVSQIRAAISATETFYHKDPLLQGPSLAKCWCGSTGVAAYNSNYIWESSEFSSLRSTGEGDRAKETLVLIEELHMEAFYQMNHKTNCFCLAEVWHIQIQFNEPATPSPFGCASSMFEWSSLWQFFCHSAGDLKRRDASQRLLLNIGNVKDCECSSSQRNVNKTN